LAAIIYPLSSLIAVMCLGAAVGVVVSYGTLPPNSESAPHGQLHRAGVNALSAGVVFLAIAGFGAVLGGWFWALIVMFVAASPKALALILRQTSRGLPPSPVNAETASPAYVIVEAAVFAPSIQVLDDHDLCQAWGRSYGWLEGTDSLALQAYIVTLRQAYLDELERRDPAGLGAWLDSCPRPRGGPEKFLHHGTDGHHLPA
jgi:hypothetical protein